MFGKFYSKQGIYEFNGKHYKARWYANALRMGIMECKAILEAGYDAGDHRWQKGILVTGIKKWNEIVQGGFGTWVGLAQIHCYDDTVNAGTVPNWAKDFDSYGGFLIHEYAPGKVLFMRDPKDLYIFFEDSAPPEPEPEPEPEPVEPKGCMNLIIEILKVLSANR